MGKKNKTEEVGLEEALQNLLQHCRKHCLLSLTFQEKSSIMLQGDIIIWNKVSEVENMLESSSLLLYNGVTDQTVITATQHGCEATLTHMQQLF